MHIRPVSKYGDWVDHLNRKISLPIAKMLVKVRVSANAITLFRSALFFFAMFFYLKAEVFFIVLAGIFIELSDILDYVDGDVARISSKTSIFGEWLEYFENNFQGSSGSLLGLAIMLGLFFKTNDVSVFAILFFLVFGFHMKKALIHIPVKSSNWSFNLMERSSFGEFKEEINRNILFKLGKVFLWISTRDINVLFLVSILFPVFYKYSGLSLLYWTMICFALAHNLTWLGIAFFQYKAVRHG